MNKNDKRYPLTYVMLIGILSIIISWWWIPQNYYYNSDVYISPAGMLISESYRTVPWHVSMGIPGFYGQGIFAIYNSWPPLNFLVLAGWQEIFGTDLVSSRWMYVFVKLLTDLLCFIIIFRITRNKMIALIAAGVFLIFPYRILYSLLLFSDSWILLFGALITLLLIRALQKENLFQPRTIFVISMLTGIGTLFSWQVFFYLPAILIYGTWNRKSSIENRKLLLWWIAGIVPAFLLMAAWFYWIIVHPVSVVTVANLGVQEPSNIFGNEQNAFLQLLNRSWWGLIQNPATETVIFLKRIFKTLLEYSPVIMLVLHNRYFNKNKKEIPVGKSLNPLIKIHTISAILYLLILPLMFSPHEHQIPLFALLATLVLARELIKISSPRILGLVMIGFQLLVFFFVIPRIHKVDYKLKSLDQKIVDIIKPGGETPKAFFIMHSGHPNHIGLLAETHTHIFSETALRKFKWGEGDIDSCFRAQLAIFPEELRKITDSSQLWILSNNKQICSTKYAGFVMETYPLKDSTCLLHLKRI